MTEEEARAWIANQFGVSRETKVAQFLDAVVAETASQNLISAGSIPHIWQRHALDSAQLVRLAPHGTGEWLDIGSGAGFPGAIVALLVDRPVRLVEPRRRRADFLTQTLIRLGADNATVTAARIESVSLPNKAAVASARAVASIDTLFAGSSACCDSGTRWILPRGRNAHAESNDAQRRWNGAFHVEQSLSDPDGGIVVATGVRPK